ncbi:hypothetical protein QBC34DRAFT_441539 [Podospora aff. communis PSN243]|uniref:SH3 domain-containing protein n=1 Tax=Podospora aff. communis PSN243 TaxID=3040156 RepID=A0AAV9GB64_9PEZI|nr:hypothetical protein QBC34DRAFT_441539 [Podospora aff. communis PSN243]
MPFPSILSRPANGVEASLGAASTNEREEDIDSDWLLVDSNGDSTPASSSQLNSSQLEATATNVELDIEVGRTTQKPQQLSSSTPSIAATANPFRVHRTATDVGARAGAGTASPSSGIGRHMNQHTSRTTTWSDSNRGKRRVLYDFVAAEDNELSVVAGEGVVLLNVDGEPDGWLVAENARGQVGWVPRAYVEEMAGSEGTKTDGSGKQGVRAAEGRGGQGRVGDGEEQEDEESADEFVDALAVPLSCQRQRRGGPDRDVGDDDNW